MSKKLKLAIIFGGKSGEHEISIVSARSIIKEVDKVKYEVKEILITKKGGWLVSGKACSISEALDGVDVAFPVLHGPYGEDGTIQGLFEIVGVPYVGSGVLASAVAMDKALAKDLFKANSLPVVDSFVVKKLHWGKEENSIVNKIEEKIGFPSFVKPANLGSSVGVSKVKKKDDLNKAIEEAFEYDNKVLVEKAVQNAREIEVAVLGNESPIPSVCGEIVPSQEFYSYEAKYVDESSELIIPAKITEKLSKEIRSLAIMAYKAVDGSGMARVDFLFDDKSENIYLNEINTIPGFTSISMYPKLWEKSGLPYPKLINRLIQLGIDRFNSKNSLRVDYPSKINP
ncbi:MAG: D-alanine--D-alanine ligase family protein [Candidatus Woykebacteria bacterium]